MLNNKVIRTTFIISLTVHFLLLATPQFKLNLSNIQKPQEIITQINIEKTPVLPKINVIGKEKKLQENIKEIKQPEPFHKIQPEEIVIREPSKKLIEEKTETINPSQEAMLRYQDIVKQKIEEKKEYPQEARRKEIEGIVNIRFTILSDGQVNEIEIVKSSGYKILDNSAVSTIKKSNPFPTLPEELNTPYVQIEVNLVYNLK